MYVYTVYTYISIYIYIDIYTVYTVYLSLSLYIYIYIYFRRLLRQAVPPVEQARRLGRPPSFRWLRQTRSVL